VIARKEWRIAYVSSIKKPSLKEGFINTYYKKTYMGDTGFEPVTSTV
jgi:hypothetical protein